MAITSYGYPVPGGVIMPGSIWAKMQKLLGRQVSFPEHPDWRPSINTGDARSVRLNLGEVGAGAVYNVSNASINVPLPVVNSGSQYFLITAKQTWGAENATTAAYVDGTAARAIPAYTDDPGTLQHIPIALARVSAGNTTITELVDLRCIAEESGVYTIFDDLALQLIERLGVTVFNKTTGITYRRVLSRGTGTAPVWERVWDTPVGVRPYFMLGRNAPYTIDSAAGPYKAYGANQTDTDGDWSAHFTHTGGTSNAAPGYIQVKTDGLYTINGRISVGSSSTIRGWAALEGGWSRITDAHETRSNPGTAILNVSDTVFLKAGARVMLVGRFYDAFRVQDWYLWMNRIGD